MSDEVKKKALAVSRLVASLLVRSMQTADGGIVGDCCLQMRPIFWPAPSPSRLVLTLQSRDSRGRRGSNADVFC